MNTAVAVIDPTGHRRLLVALCERRLVLTLPHERDTENRGSTEQQPSTLVAAGSINRFIGGSLGVARKRLPLLT